MKGMLEVAPAQFIITESGGLEVKDELSMSVMEPQSALKLARAIIAVHEQIFQREKALRDPPQSQQPETD
jgi:maleate cis-trans isomerase